MHAADVLVLTEYRSGEAGRSVCAPSCATSATPSLSPVEPPGIRNGVLIATRVKPAGPRMRHYVPAPMAHADRSRSTACACSASTCLT